jgi:hypothetical protein
MTVPFAAVAITLLGDVTRIISFMMRAKMGAFSFVSCTAGLEILSIRSPTNVSHIPDGIDELRASLGIVVGNGLSRLEEEPNLLLGAPEYERAADERVPAQERLGVDGHDFLTV